MNIFSWKPSESVCLICRYANHSLLTQQTIYFQRAAKAVCVHESVLGKAASLQVTPVHLQGRACLHDDQNQMCIPEYEALCRPVGSTWIYFL